MRDLVERWERLLTPARLAVRDNGPEREVVRDADQTRTVFAQDADRIIFSNAFRRLSKKTQVHPLATNDHIHNRLTHSLEVASVGRSLGALAGSRLQEKSLLPGNIGPHNIGEIVQAACLAHDLGNPPYGHGGEAAIQCWFTDKTHAQFTKPLSQAELSDFTCFDGNAQSFRVVTVLENNLGRGGMRLTYPTLGAMIKYPRSSTVAQSVGKKKYGFTVSETHIFAHLAEVLGLEGGNGQWMRHPLSYLSEAADDICYSLIDLEDAQEMKLLTISEMYEALACLHGKSEDAFFSKGRTSGRAEAAYLRSVSIGILVRDVAATFIDNLEDLTRGCSKGDLIEACCAQTRTAIRQAKAMAAERIFPHPRKVTLEIGAYAVFERLLNTLLPAVYSRVNNEPASFRTGRILDLLGDKFPADSPGCYPAYQAVIDFVAGMTDDYATFVSSQFAGAGK